MFDVDHFKRVNDGHGHDVGDQALRELAHEVAHHCRIVGRLGGEEFAILLEGANQPAAIALAELLRVAVSMLREETASGPLTLTCSFGVSEWGVNHSLDQLLKRADLALYEAKHAGRNRVVAADAARRQDGDARPRSVIRAVARG